MKRPACLFWSWSIPWRPIAPRPVTASSGWLTTSLFGRESAPTPTAATCLLYFTHGRGTHTINLVACESKASELYIN